MVHFRFSHLILGALANLSCLAVSAQFAPAAGQPGSTALRFDSGCFVNWANSCILHRGLRDVSHPDSGYASVGDTNSAKGSAKQNGVASLGDGGYAILSFPNPIQDGTGWDFAVFENTFIDSFLELAFVEVSSDGKRFVRFPSESLTDTSKQTGAFGYTRPEKVNNLAGKYIIGYGAPFDLQELKDSSGLDINNIRYVKVVDVVGSIDSLYATRDSKGRKVNDPWPTPFPSSGFDLDAVGVIHQNTSAKTNTVCISPSIKLWPNPVYENILHIQSSEQLVVILYNLMGEKIEVFSIQKGENSLQIHLPPGMYYAMDAKSGLGLGTIQIK